MNGIAATRENEYRLKCLQIADSLSPDKGGTSRAIIDLARSLCDGGMDVRLASLDVGPQDNEFKKPLEGLSIHRLSSSSLDAEASELLRESDVLHLHTPWWPRNRQLVQLAKAMDKPVVLTPHGMLDDWSMSQKRIKKAIYLQLFGKPMISACHVHCTAEAEKQQLLKRLTPKSTTVIPLVIDPMYLQMNPSPDIARDRWAALADNKMTKVLFLSRLHPKKGLDVAIQAIALTSNTRLFVAGPCDSADYLNSLKKMADRAGVSNRIEWMGSVYGEEKYSLMTACDCIVLPTLQENFGLVLIEALTLGLKVITSKGTDIWQELRSCGALIADRTPESFASKIRGCSVLSDEERKQNLRTQRENVRRWIDPKAVAQTYMRFYKSLIQSHGPVSELA